MKIKILLLACLLFTAGLPFHPAAAESKMFLSPTRVNLDERHKVETINISNVTDTPHSYKVSVKDLVMTEKGVTVPSDHSEFSAKKMVRYFPREFSVQPGQHQTVRVMAKIPADTPDGDYHSHIEFFEDVATTTDQSGGEAKTSVKAAFSYSTLIPITVSKGAVDTKIGWTQPGITRSAKPGDYKIQFQLTREGNGQGTAYIDVFYIAPSGEATQIGKRRTAYIYREISKKDYAFDAGLPPGASPGGKIKLSLLNGDKTNPTQVSEASLALP